MSTSFTGRRAAQPVVPRNVKTKHTPLIVTLCKPMKRSFADPHLRQASTLARFASEAEAQLSYLAPTGRPRRLPPKKPLQVHTYSVNGQVSTGLRRDNKGTGTLTPTTEASFEAFHTQKLHERRHAVSSKVAPTLIHHFTGAREGVALRPKHASCRHTLLQSWWGF